jgi:hypothetical protein
MMRYLGVLAGLCGLALATGVTVLTVHGRLDSGPVYMEAQVQARLARNPEAWLGRTVRIRGWVDGCPGILVPGVQPECLGQTLYYLADATAPATEPLLLVKVDPGPLLVALRRLPLPGALLPAPQALHWEVAATYRVRLQPAPAAGCYPTPPCYEALLLDAAP